MFRALAAICAFIWADHANAGGLGDFLKAIESLDQSIQEKVQDVLGAPESDHGQAQEEPPSTKVTTTPVTSSKIQIKAQPGVAKESTGTKEEDESNLISSEKIRLKPDMILKEGSTGETGTSEPGGVVKTGTSVGDGDNRQTDVSSQASTVSVTNEGESGGEGEILWLGSATDIVERYGASGGVVTKKVLWRVRLREGYRLNIVDADDRLLGQLVRLDDDGSTWTASQFGHVVCPDGREVQYDGGASGVLATDSPAGWVYYSLVDDDPLKDLLPNGAYYVSALDKSDGRSFSESSLITYYHNVLAGFRWSVENSNPIPDEAHNGMRVPVDSFRAIFRYFTGDYSTWDPKIRVAADGQMSGSYMRPILPGTSKCVSKTQRRAFWSVDRIYEVKPSLEEVQRNWRPEHDNEANTLFVTASVEQPAIPGKFRFTLFDVTREKGWAMNAGDKDDDSLDLEFLDGLAGFLTPEETSDGWTIETNRTMTSATVTIKANDYGAWGKLKCEVNPGGQWFPCTSENGEGYVTIPLDEDENKIADFWEEDKDVSGDAAADDDETPEGREPGDGFSNYEEYRGFHIKGEWADTNPREKDLFVHNDADDKKVLIDAGIGLFEKASELTVHKIEADEYDEQRIVNFNRGEHQAITRDSKGQKGLHIVVVEDLGEGICGKAPGPGLFLGGPNVTEPIQIVDRCVTPERYFQQGHYENVDADRIFVGSREITSIEYLDLLFAGKPVGLMSMIGVGGVAHELGHGVNLWHPGLDWGTFECGAGTVEPRGGSMYSGPEDNLMRYAGPSQQYVDGKCYDLPYHLDNTPQTAFARSLGGTGINAGSLKKIEEEDGSEYWLPMAGDASCTGTLITNMSLNQDKETTWPKGCEF